MARVVFTVANKEMILLHGFKKKTQRLTVHDLKLARHRVKQYMNKRKK